MMTQRALMSMSWYGPLTFMRLILFEVLTSARMHREPALVLDVHSLPSLESLSTTQPSMLTEAVG